MGTSTYQESVSSFLRAQPSGTPDEKVDSVGLKAKFSNRRGVRLMFPLEKLRRKSPKILPGTRGNRNFANSPNPVNPLGYLNGLSTDRAGPVSPSSSIDPINVSVLTETLSMKTVGSLSLVDRIF